MLRRIYEIYKDKRHIDPNQNPFCYCPICKNVLEKFEQDDVWMKGIKSNNSHKFFERGELYISQSIRNKKIYLRRCQTKR
jgi:hypothetical protein